MIQVSTFPERIPSPSVRLRVGILMSASVILLCTAVVIVTALLNEEVMQERERARWLDALQHQFEQADTIVAAAPTLEPMLHTLKEGGSIQRANGEIWSLSAPTDPTTRDALERLLTAWQTFVHAQSTESTTETRLHARLALQTAVAKAMTAVEARQAEGIGMVRGMYATLFLSSLLFLLLGLWLLQQNIVAPVEQLQRIAHRIARGDLDTPVALGGHGEFLDLTRSFETMRQELRRSREQMQRWTQDLQAYVARRTQQISALSEVIATASRSLELDTVLNSALEQSLAVINAPYGGVWLLDENTQRLTLVTSQHLPPAMRHELHIMEVGDGVTGRAAETNQVIVLEDVLQHPGPIKAVAIREGIRSVVAVPLRLRERVTGVLNVMLRQPRTFTPEEIALLTSIGQQMAIAVDSLRLMQAIQEQTRQMAMLRERERIGIELHDGVLQTLSYLYLQTDQLALAVTKDGLTDLAEKLHAQREVISQLAREIRQFIANLKQATVLSVPVQTALQEMLATFHPPPSLHIHLDLAPAPLYLDAERREHLLRLAREAIFNAIQHSQARNINVHLKQHDQAWELVIQDDGQGFDPAYLFSQAGEHFGLRIMQARAARIGGHLNIESQPGQGTLIRLVFAA
jgi:two-component system nitrate/nitrite sensor histidine kinase NarX